MGWATNEWALEDGGMSEAKRAGRDCARRVDHDYAKSDTPKQAEAAIVESLS